MSRISADVLELAGFGNTRLEDYRPRAVALRNGRQTVVWIHEHTGHGILDRSCWEDGSFYEATYREEFGPDLDAQTLPAERLRIHAELNAKQFRTFAELLDHGCRFLEIGCGSGGILQNALEFGVGECHAVEPNQQDADFVARRWPEAKVFHDVFGEVDLPHSFYDVVASIEVLEHVASPRAFLDKCRAILKPGGRLHLEVPNLDDVLLTAYRDSGYDDFFYHKAHIHYFTRRSLSELCSDCGFEGEVSSFLMYPFFNHVWWHQHRGPQRSATAAWATPRPTAGRTPAEQAINTFYRQVEADYEALVNDWMLGDCLVYQGVRVPEKTCVASGEQRTRVRT
ncbi:MAG: class I SAM-dependent methyltransferase [Planctomycetota bacterium]|jgi:2-polyprenyl-3-methyl-5-hydroxy-6-metoxy-1,4-benzoquinol methylase